MSGRRDFLRRTAHAGFGLAALPLAVPPARRGLAPRGSAAAQADDYWDRVRDLFPMTRDRAYLNTGGLGPASYPVLDTVSRATLETQTIVEHRHQAFEIVRGPVAAFLGARPEEIAFQRNATEGNSTIAAGLALRRGDEVVFESHAHPGGAYAWRSRQERDGIVVKTFVPDPASAAGNLERIEAALTPRTRAIQVSHITAPTGIQMPVRQIAELARDRGLWFHVDGAQSAGHVQVDLGAIGCDSYATSGHKWLGAPHGTGVLYVRADRLDEVWPTEVGAYTGGPTPGGGLEYAPSAVRFEPGTRNAPLVLGVGAAVALLDEIGMDRVETRARALGCALHTRLEAIDGVEVLTPSDPALRAGITTLRSERVPFMELYQAYLDAAMRCRIVTEEGLDAVRVSTHIFNSEAECDRVVEVTREALARA